ncbi:MAG: DUF3786 domain-containing protein [Nitrospirae bacterium]|nr:DUF3786 domain-containing protein [Nitrospirota bacterium]MCL5237896.1 DUF3786 domain-containing protein [Nitrospirota bacterium]
MYAGEEKAWEILSGLSPAAVCRESGLLFDESSGLYIMRSFSMDFSISPRDRTISGNAPESPVLLNRLGYFFKLSVPWYAISAKDIPLTGKLVKPVGLKGGQLFFRGTHVLPLDRLALKYGNDVDGFIKRAGDFGGEAIDYGDASFRFHPLPRVPLVLILWAADEEFPARADILFDSTCEFHLPLDIIWSVAMMSILIMF